MIRLLKISALVSGVVLLNAVTTLLFVQSRVPAAAQLAAPCVDGDVNGDAGLDIVPLAEIPAAELSASRG